MPKLGMEPIRRSALVEATIAEIGAAGHLDVTVGQIARRAGVSSGLAHHYFGGKDQILLAAMRQILRDFGQEVLDALKDCGDARSRARAIIRASFAQGSFEPATINAWMTLYAHAPMHDEMRRLLELYQKRLQSNLTYALRPISSDPEADARVLGALIDGLYLRAALSRDMNSEEATTLALRLLDRILETRS